MKKEKALFCDNHVQNPPGFKLCADLFGLFFFIQLKLHSENIKAQASFSLFVPLLLNDCNLGNKMH